MSASNNVGDRTNIADSRGPHKAI